MNLFDFRKFNRKSQIIICSIAVTLVAIACFLFGSLLGYRTVALILLMTVSILAMLFDILPVLLAAVSSAIIWNFFFIPPILTFHITDTEDLLMFFLYFFVAMLNAVLTVKIREAEKKARDKEEKDNAIKLYNTLLNSLSHELRTPLATIIGSVDTLKELHLPANKQQELLDEIERAGIRLNKQVENLLNMSRLETGMLSLNKDWCDINELINESVRKTISDSGRNVFFTPNEDLPLFRIDRGLVEQVLNNLLSNAMQHTPDNCSINISTSMKNDLLTIIVSDNGNGIPSHALETVFEKFYRLPQSKTGGSGLGLSIVKGIVEAHAGTVKVENNENGGASFIIDIPAETSYLNRLKNE